MCQSCAVHVPGPLLFTKLSFLPGEPFSLKKKCVGPIHWKQIPTRRLHGCLSPQKNGYAGAMRNTLVDKWLRRGATPGLRESCLANGRSRTPGVPSRSDTPKDSSTTCQLFLHWYALFQEPRVKPHQNGVSTQKKMTQPRGFRLHRGYGLSDASTAGTSAPKTGNVGLRRENQRMSKETKRIQGKPNKTNVRLQGLTPSQVITSKISSVPPFARVPCSSDVR